MYRDLSTKLDQSNVEKQCPSNASKSKQCIKAMLRSNVQAKQCPSTKLDKQCPSRRRGVNTIIDLIISLSFSRYGTNQPPARVEKW